MIGISPKKALFLCTQHSHGEGGVIWPTFAKMNYSSVPNIVKRVFSDVVLESLKAENLSGTPSVIIFDEC